MLSSPLDPIAVAPGVSQVVIWAPQTSPKVTHLRTKLVAVPGRLPEKGGIEKEFRPILADPLKSYEMIRSSGIISC